MLRGFSPRADTASRTGDLIPFPADMFNSSDGTDQNRYRKQTLMALLDALTALTKEEDLGGNMTQQPSFEDDRDVPTVDEHLQRVGAEAFNKFQRRITNLDRELRNFANATRQLGSSVGILSSSFHLRERLAQLLHLFRENAVVLFPRKVNREPREPLVNPVLRKLRKRSRANLSNAIPVRTGTANTIESLEAEDFPEQLGLFAQDVITFLDCLNEFPEFTDEAVNSAILSLEGDLKYWASCLASYEGQFKFPAVQRYLHDISSEMGEHLDSITSALSIFIEIGVPTIQFAQEHAAANLLNLSTVATFFSAVTATTLQFSFDHVDDPLSNAVNGFWFTSLVFSIGAAVNSLLGLTWKRALYRSPGHRVPWWVLIWIKRSPLVFLVLSIACFSMGLVIFTYSSHQHPITAVFVTTFSTCSCFGLAAVSAWFASERWIYTQHRGRKWLADALSETKIRLSTHPSITWVVERPRTAAQKVAYWGQRRGSNASEFFASVRDSIIEILRVRRAPTVAQDDQEKNVTPGSSQATPLSPEPMTPLSPYFNRPSDTVTALLPISESQVTGRSDQKTTVSEPSGSDTNTPSQGQGRLKQAVRSVILMNRTANMGFSFRRQQSTSSDDVQSGKQTESPPVPKGSRVAALVPKLKSLEATQDLAAHSALVRNLQFSPNGKFLASSSWDRTTVIFRVGDPFTSHRVLAHPQSFVGQVAWSPNGSTLLTKRGRRVRLWTEEGVCKKTIDRKRSVQSVTWLPGGDAFMSVEGSDVVKIDLTGAIMDQYHLDRMIVHDVAVTQNGQRMLLVATLTASAGGLQPSKSRAEKQIISYNLDKKEVESRVPVLHEVRDITLARTDQVALVSYENKAPPQLWKIELYKDTSRLSLRHTYMPKFAVDFAGPSYFGGKHDQLILCAGKAGDIHIWDRDSGALLHHVRAQALGGDLTCIAWNHAHENFMFATGSHDGAIRIWTTPDGDNDNDNEQHQNYSDEIGPWGSSRLTSNAHTPRTSSPLPFDTEDRTESPSAAQLTAALTEPQDGLELPGVSSSNNLDGRTQDGQLSEPIMYRGDRKAVTFT